MPKLRLNRKIVAHSAPPRVHSRVARVAPAALVSACCGDSTAMESYGQYCPLAKGAEVFAERWTPLILRELLRGSTTFNDLHHGVPRMSRSLLSMRLKKLESCKVL